MDASEEAYCTHVAKLPWVNARSYRQRASRYCQECPFSNTRSKNVAYESLLTCLHCGSTSCHEHAAVHSAQHDHLQFLDIAQSCIYCFKCDIQSGLWTRVLSSGVRVSLMDLLAMDENVWNFDKNDVDIYRDHYGEGSLRSLFQMIQSHRAMLPARAGRIGLRNLGNTCYLNTCIQVLSCCAPLTQLLLCTPSMGRKMPMTTHLRSLLSVLWLPIDERKSVRSTVRPDELIGYIGKIQPQFRGYAQQDAHECLRLLVAVLEEEWREDVPEQAQNNNANNNNNKNANTNAHPSKKKRKSRSSSQAALNAVISVANMYDPRQRSFVSATFGGLCVSRVECSHCGKHSDTIESFSDLSLPIPDGKLLRRIVDVREKMSLFQHYDGVDQEMPPSHHSVVIEEGMLEQSSSLFGALINTVSWPVQWALGYDEEARVDLRDCLFAHFATTTLSGENQYRCGDCGVPRPAKTFVRLLRSPEVLCINLKRFRSGDGIGTSKISTFVAFPIMGLDLSEFCVPPSDMDAVGKRLHNECSLYDLSGVVVHIGGYDGGHYIAFCKHPSTHVWLCFNDSVVTSVTEGDVCSQEAYILFYTRRHTTKSAAALVNTQRRTDVMSSLQNCRWVQSVQCDVFGLWESRREMALCDLFLVHRAWLNQVLLLHGEPAPLNNNFLLCKHGVLALNDASANDIEMTLVEQKRCRELYDTYACNAHLFVSDSNDDDNNDNAHNSEEECARLPFHLVAKSVVVTAHAWHMLTERCGSVPGITCAQLRVCIECGAERALKRRRRVEKDVATAADSLPRGTYSYMLSSRWIDSWLFFTEGGPLPGAISNCPDLCDDNGVLLHNELLFDDDYRPVNRTLWTFFVQQYGGGPVLIRGDDNIYSEPIDEADAVEEVIVADSKPVADNISEEHTSDNEHITSMSVSSSVEAMDTVDGPGDADFGVNGRVV